MRNAKPVQRAIRRLGRKLGLPKAASLKIDGDPGPKTVEAGREVAFYLGKRPKRHQGLDRALRKAIRRPATRTRAEKLRGRARQAKLRRRQRRAKPPIITAAQIGLAFQWVFGAKGAVVRGATHYTAGPRAAGRAALVALAIQYHRYHASLGWGGFSYDAFIADDGTILLGNPIGRKSAAVANLNTGTINICCPGTTGDRLTDAQKRSVRWLLDNWHTRKVPATHRLPRPARSIEWRVHKNWHGQSTACPGDMTRDYEEIHG